MPDGKEQDLTCVSFKDTAFLQMFGLSEMNVLDYFSQSQFYDPLCINEQLKMQARFNELNAQQLDITSMKGVEFSLWYFTLQPSYFVIRKSQRYSPTTIDGTIFQAPYLDVLIGNRLKTALHFLEKAMDKTVETSLFHPLRGYSWKSDQSMIEKTRKEIADMAENNKLTVKTLTLDSQRREMKFNNSISKAIQDAFVPEPPQSISVMEPTESKPSIHSNGSIKTPKTPSTPASSGTVPSGKKSKRDRGKEVADEQTTRGEPIRLALKLAGINFEDERIDFKQWPERQNDPSFPSGQLPVLYVDGNPPIAQSTAILRYVGKFGKGDLYPKDPYEAALVDQLISMVQDVEFSLAPSAAAEPEKKALLRKTLAEERLPKLFGYIDRFVGSCNKKFAVRDTVTVGDLFMYQMSTSYSSGAYDGIPTNVLNGFSNIARIVAAVKSLPEVQAWEAAH